MEKRARCSRKRRTTVALVFVQVVLNVGVGVVVLVVANVVAGVLKDALSGV